MNMPPSISSAKDSLSPRHAQDTRLRGQWLVAVRVAWVVVSLLTLALFIAAVPARYRQLLDVCVTTSCRDLQLSLAEVQVLSNLGLSVSSYAGFLLTLEIITTVVFASVGLLVFSRKSDDWVALFAAMTGVIYGPYITVPLDVLLSIAPFWGFLSNFVQALGFWCAVVFYLVVPNGRFTPRWTRYLAIACAAYTVPWIVIPSLPFNHANPFTLAAPWAAVHLGWFLAGMLAQIQRYQYEADPIQRQQTKWVVFSLIIAVVGWAAFVVLRALASLPDHFLLARLLYTLAGEPVYLISLLVVPLAVTISILRYRLWEIDVIINRTLVYGLVTLALAGVYVGSIFLLQAILLGFTEQYSNIAVVGSTLVIAALFHPLRRRAQATIDRRFYRQKYDAAQTLQVFSATIADEVNLMTLTRDITAVVQDTMHPAHVSLWLNYGAESGDLGPPGALGTGSPTWAALEGEIAVDDPLVVYLRGATSAVELAKLHLASPALNKLRSRGVTLVVPLIGQHQLIGLLNLGPRISGQEYSSDDRRLLNTLACQAAPAIRVAQLVWLRQQELQERERIEHELQIAHLIQKTLLPKSEPTLPGWQVKAYYRPARAVGGDFYDFLPLPDGRIGLIIGDVSGKGVPAALVMATTRSILRSVAQQLRSPGQVLAQANNLLDPDIPSNMFVTCLYAVLDPASGELHFANAGHDLPYRWHDGSVDELRATGMPLGLLPDMHYEEKETTLLPGDRLLLYSDGLVEAHNAQGEMFSFNRLQGLLTEHTAIAPSLIEFLLDALRQFTGRGWEQEDDITLVMLERAVLP